MEPPRPVGCSSRSQRAMGLAAKIAISSHCPPASRTTARPRQDGNTTDGDKGAVDKVQEAMMRDRTGLVWACIVGSSCAADGGVLVPQCGEEHGVTHRCA